MSAGHSHSDWTTLRLWSHQKCNQNKKQIKNSSGFSTVTVGTPAMFRTPAMLLKMSGQTCTEHLVVSAIHYEHSTTVIRNKQPFHRCKSIPNSFKHGLSVHTDNRKKKKPLLFRQMLKLNTQLKQIWYNITAAGRGVFLSKNVTTKKPKNVNDGGSTGESKERNPLSHR